MLKMGNVANRLGFELLIETIQNKGLECLCTDSQYNIKYEELCVKDCMCIIIVTLYTCKLCIINFKVVFFIKDKVNCILFNLSLMQSDAVLSRKFCQTVEKFCEGNQLVMFVIIIIIFITNATKANGNVYNNNNNCYYNNNNNVYL